MDHFHMCILDVVDFGPEKVKRGWMYVLTQPSVAIIPSSFLPRDAL